MGSKDGGIKQIQNRAHLFEFDEMFPDQKLDSQKYAIKLNVRGTGILEIDQYVLHPFVRIHVIDMDTHKYLRKTDNLNPGVTNKESCSFFKVDPQKNEKTPM